MLFTLNNKLILYLITLLYFGNLSSNAQEYPEVTFHYTYIPFDRWCSKSIDIEIKDIWIRELYSKMDMFKKTWDDDGTRLLKVTVEEVGKPFEKEELQATMTLCRSRSMSHPLLIGMQKYLNSATDNNSIGEERFVATVFHEVLHIYVFDILKEKEEVPLLEKYKQESSSVRNHLHLMALIKNAYLKLGWEKELESIIESDMQAGGAYRRSWEILNNEESYKAFIKELVDF